MNEYGAISYTKLLSQANHIKLPAWKMGSGMSIEFRVLRELGSGMSIEFTARDSTLRLRSGQAPAVPYGQEHALSCFLPSESVSCSGIARFRTFSINDGVPRCLFPSFPIKNPTLHTSGVRGYCPA